LFVAEGLPRIIRSLKKGAMEQDLSSARMNLHTAEFFLPALGRRVRIELKLNTL
jgi:hypothetical protein